ncbi:cell division protein FtsL [Marispirochaeta sp.]|jgi:cell division protein FtsL|uniref:cell division protein FtsL n=1 Tax=Marispirochaeta sp. TaxID=2038653 RepID=UPI0029C8EEF5|nr:cell division protein FtsL [Marispirochaeta sp.]
MKRLLVVIMLISVPALLFLNIWQGYRFWETERYIARMQDEQQQWFEENKLMIVNIAVASSPARISELARDLGLKKIDQQDIVRVRIPGRGNND